MNNTRIIALKRSAKRTPLTTQIEPGPSVSLVGLFAIFACITVFVVDQATHSNATIGIVFVMALVLLSNESPKTIVLFGGTATVLLLAKLILLMGVHVDGIVRGEKYTSIVAICGITVGLVRYRELTEQKETQQKIKRGGKIIQMNIDFKQTEERPATARELRPFLKHIKKSSAPLDPYTRDLTLFIYSKSTKN